MFNEINQIMQRGMFSVGDCDDEPSGWAQGNGVCKFGCKDTVPEQSTQETLEDFAPLGNGSNICASQATYGPANTGGNERKYWHFYSQRLQYIWTG